MPLFDAYIFVDWSASNSRHPRRPTADAVWTGELLRNLNSPQVTYHRTRNDGAEHVQEALLKHAQEGHRVLVGFDFPYGYPTGFASALGRPSGAQSWSAIWAILADRISDTADNVNNRFAVAGDLNAIAGNGRSGPFWGCPHTIVVANLSSTSPGFPFEATGGRSLQRLRITETHLHGTLETWGLFGAGRVGSQALMGIPYVYKLRRHPELAHISHVWPFETEFTLNPIAAEGPFILHAEIWPGVVSERVQAILAENPDMIRDQAQVRAMCEWAAELDEQGDLGWLFAEPNGLNQQQVRVCVEEEGWILGAT